MDNYTPTPNAYYEALEKKALEDRTIWFNDMVDEVSCTQTILYLEKLEKVDRAKEQKPKITIICNSNGGLCYQGLMLISKMESMIEDGYEIETITGGMSASMSFMIGISGSTRKGMKYSTYLCHQPSAGAIGTALKIKRESDELDRIWGIMKNIIKKKTKMSDELLDKIYETELDYIMDSEEALKLGVIDEII